MRLVPEDVHPWRCTRPGWWSVVRVEDERVAVRTRRPPWTSRRSCSATASRWWCISELLSITFDAPQDAEDLADVLLHLDDHVPRLTDEEIEAAREHARERMRRLGLTTEEERF